MISAGFVNEKRERPSFRRTKVIKNRITAWGNSIKESELQTC